MALSLAVDGLHAGYGAVKALRGVTLHVKAGETVALLGTNGNGKSTLIKCIMGLVRPERGSVSLTVDGRDYDLTTLSPEGIVDLGVALVPEGRRLFPKLTVAENLMLGAFRRAARSAIRQNLAIAFETFPALQARQNQIAGTLSGGQQQMLAIARALMSSPRLLLVDEASLGLSPVMTKTVFDLIADVRRTAGTAVLVVEQNAGALDLADRAFVLEKGQVVDRAEGAEMRAMQGRLRDAYLGRREAG